ncbi:MAG: hypothetical protein C4520_15860 [Candidatus Abyssobacteria bacterium SURF_5]|uniref:Radical SAM protein n=1 Tax=Abyssobacteria bacterium (strain SURF_5) TaxID=2093360 RepID=A0A3A4N916_ABYX5|nr:MAG: hypothetical protein C4520_15860 [Candidatus Abyssubacteria bacterium SURF_5]
MKTFEPQKIYVEKAAASHPRAQRILKSFPRADISYVEDHRRLDFSHLTPGKRFTEAKKYLAIALKQGAMVKEFRRHDSLNQDKEYYLLHAENCPFDCSYCYLQCYFANAVPTIFVNADELFMQVREILENERSDEILFHAGETADALALEHFSGFAAEAVELFSRFHNATLELRTKSDLIDTILPLRHNRRTVVSWTLTPLEISRKYEVGAASIEERLKAARKCASAGYPIGLRLDPIIHYHNWQAGYENLADLIADALPLETIDSIVLGAFRFQPPLLDVMRARFGRDELVLAEFVPGPDGKMRYFRHIREEMYREIIGFFRERNGDKIIEKIELSMEPPYTWEGAGLRRNSMHTGM